ncbi:MAG: hypothetical protein RLO17_23620 [Cyclobacteriaceae bacterium]|jgi:hypothetical protein|tara:strand:- start:2387 stop:3022 length:636 start_codon:yes stop_codon:yes gene_type:complete
MELSNLVTYKSSFTILRITLLLVIVIFTCSFIGLYYYTSVELEKANNRVFLLEASGNMMVAGAMDVVSKKDFELMVEDHVRDFYHLFFSFDENNYSDNTERALKLIGTSGVELFDNYRRENVLARLKEANAVVEIEIEQVIIEVKNINNIRAQVKAVQTTRAGNNSISRRMDSNIFDVIRKGVTRTIENPHGLRIENFVIVDKSEVKENNR